MCAFMTIFLQVMVKEEMMSIEKLLDLCRVVGENTAPH
jgi:hypothetical protein